MQLSLTEYLEGLTEYPFALLIAQHEVEHILEEKLNGLGVTVRREMRVKGMEASDSKGIKLTFENGETAQATYLIGADGSKSTVRSNNSMTNQLKPFEGTRTGRDIIYKPVQRRTVLHSSPRSDRRRRRRNPIPSPRGRCFGGLLSTHFLAGPFERYDRPFWHVTSHTPPSS